LNAFRPPRCGSSGCGAVRTVSPVPFGCKGGASTVRHPAVRSFPHGGTATRTHIGMIAVRHTPDSHRLDRAQTNINDQHYLVYRYLFPDLLAAVRTYAVGDVLDIGCGNKPYLSYFDGLASSYTGCDVMQSNEHKVDVLCLATHIPLADATKDTVFSTQVIEHVADHRALLAEAFRILRPGGHLILSGPMCWEHHEVPFDFFRFTRYGLDHLLVTAGFTVKAIVPNGGKWALVGQMFLNSAASSFMRPQTVTRRTMALLYSVLRVKWMVNLVFGALDRIDRDVSATLNFVAVAQKPPEAAGADAI
jgi:SAM-dependent methyltransferase